MANEHDEKFVSTMLSGAEVVVAVKFTSQVEWEQDEVGVHHANTICKVLKVFKGHAAINSTIKPFITVYSSDIINQYKFVVKNGTAILFLKSSHSKLTSQGGLFSLQRYDPILSEYLQRVHSKPSLSTSPHITK